MVEVHVTYRDNSANTTAITTIMTWMGFTIVFCITQYGLAGWSKVNQIPLMRIANNQKNTKLSTMVNHWGQICRKRYNCFFLIYFQYYNDLLLCHFKQFNAQLRSLLLLISLLMKLKCKVI